MKTIRRDTLMRMVDRGEMEAKCDLHLTDDYRFDNANDFGKTGWVTARISLRLYRISAAQAKEICKDTLPRNGRQWIGRLSDYTRVIVTQKTIDGKKVWTIQQCQFDGT